MLNIYRIHCTLRFLSRVELRDLPLITLRGAIGKRLLDRCSAPQPDGNCMQCPQVEQCAYPLLFAPGQLPRFATHGRPDPPMPWAAELPHPCPATVQPGEELEIVFNIFGTDAFASARELTGAVAAAGAHGLGKKDWNYEVTATRLETEAGVFQPLQSGADWLRPQPYRWEYQPGSGPLTVKFVTPVKIISNGRLLDQLPFAKLCKAVRRRRELIEQFWGEEPYSEPEPLHGLELVRALDSWLEPVKLRRYSTRTGKPMEIKALAGQVTYDSRARIMLDELLEGAFLHVGKHTSFGMGRYLLM